MHCNAKVNLRPTNRWCWTRYVDKRKLKLNKFPSSEFQKAERRGTEFKCKVNLRSIDCKIIKIDKIEMHPAFSPPVCYPTIAARVTPPADRTGTRTPITGGAAFQGGLGSKKIDFAKALHRSAFLFEGTPLQRSIFRNAAPPQIFCPQPPLKTNEKL